MGIFRSRARREPLDVTQLQLDNDVGGLVRALAGPPDTVKQAAEALAAIHRREGEPIRGRVVGAAQPLLQAVTRLQSQADVPVDATNLMGAGDAESALWAVFAALGEIADPTAVPILCSVAASPTSPPPRRRSAIEALGAMRAVSASSVLVEILRDPRIDARVSLSTDSAALTDAAAGALVRLGDSGIAALAEEVTTGGTGAGPAIAALRTVGAGQAGADRAAAVVAAWEAATARQRQAVRAQQEAEELATRARRREEHPVAAALADRLGHPEWLAESGVLSPDSYAAALDECRSFGFAVAEQEEVIDDETSEVWATVTGPGGTVLIQGGRQFRDVLY